MDINGNTTVIAVCIAAVIVGIGINFGWVFAGATILTVALIICMLASIAAKRN